MIEITPFEPEMADEVTRCYNEVATLAPHCYPVEVARFRDLGSLSHQRLRDEAIFVARDNGLEGFVHLGIALPGTGEEPMGEPAVIRFLAYPVGRRAIGQRLLDHTEQWAREHGRAEMHAFHAAYRYPFHHFGWAHLSESIGHVRALLGQNSYQIYNGEMYMIWQDYQPPAATRPDLEFELEFNWQQAPIGERLNLRAMQGGKQIGICNMDHGLASPAPDASNWAYCDWLCVNDEMQGRRLGVFLLATALAEMRKRGCKHAAISTNVTNYRAELFYANLGYRVIDLTHVWRKELQ